MMIVLYIVLSRNKLRNTEGRAVLSAVWEDMVLTS